jgi:hypothetical protein
MNLRHRPDASPIIKNAHMVYYTNVSPADCQRPAGIWARNARRFQASADSQFLENISSQIAAMAGRFSPVTVISLGRGRVSACRWNGAPPFTGSEAVHTPGRNYSFCSIVPLSAAVWRSSGLSVNSDSVVIRLSSDFRKKLSAAAKLPGAYPFKKS